MDATQPGSAQDSRWTLQRRRRTPPGSSPGTLVADPTAARPVIQVIGYGADEFEEREIADLDSLRAHLGKWPVTWVNVDGLGDLDLIRGLGEMFGLHRLALEDVVNVHQRPKVEEYGDHVFIVTRMLLPRQAPQTEQVTLFLGANYLLTFQERPGDCLDPVRDRLRRHRGLIRDAGPDYLAYAVLDGVIDGYFPILEELGTSVEELEDEVIARPDEAHVRQAYRINRELLTLRRAVWPQREMINALIRCSSRNVTEQTRIYLRDCLDHTVQLMDMIEAYREISSGLVQVYLSSINARMSEVMKMLAMIGTIFIPLGFIASVFGMNFDPDASPLNMPELRWYWGYPAALALMAGVGVGMLIYFHRKGWIGGRARPRKRGQR